MVKPKGPKELCPKCPKIFLTEIPFKMNAPEVLKKIVLFDGVCDLCNKSVQFIVKRDVADVFRLASLQSDFGQKFLEQHQKSTTDFDSIILIDENNKFYTESTAALKIAQDLKGVKWMRFFLILPKFIRDGVYRVVAKHRYKWFGKRAECMIPTPELKAKFIDV